MVVLHHHANMTRVFHSVLLLAIIASAHCLVGVCEWLGDSPFCGQASCPDGFKEIARETFAASLHDFAIFGGLCATGEKTLCCKDRFVHAEEPKKHCFLNSVVGDCPEGTDAVYTRLIWGVFSNTPSFTYCCQANVLNEAELNAALTD